ncbi:MAG TPA: hypothetical protein VGL71_02565, partial [Urbifossiella sp.]
MKFEQDWSDDEFGAGFLAIDALGHQHPLIEILKEFRARCDCRDIREEPFDGQRQAKTGFNVGESEFAVRH